MDGRPTWTDCDVVPNVLSPRDLVFRHDNMDETVPHTDAPRQKYIDMLDKFNKRNIKHILSLPTTTADPAIYILSGALPVEAIIHQRALTFFGCIARLPETSVEKQENNSPQGCLSTLDRQTPSSDPTISESQVARV